MLVVYAVVAAVAVVAETALLTLGPARPATAAAPLAAVAESGTWVFLEPLVQAAGAVASAGVLLSLMAGIGRTTLAMARDRELPAVLVAVHPWFRVPHRAELLLGAVVVAIVLVTDLRGAIGFSSFTALVYYAIANAAAFTLPRAHRQRPGTRPLAVVGLLGCLRLALTLPAATVLNGVLVLAVRGPPERRCAPSAAIPRGAG